MITVKITCDNGDTWISSVSSTFEQAKEYFMHLPITDEDCETGEETTKTVIDIKQI